MKGVLFVTFAIFISAIFAIRGVAPEDAKLYSGNTFTCKESQKKIPMARTNDDYCDCEDGSDEPGTSACANGRFYCVNKGHRGEHIFSSRVNDGICGKNQCKLRKC